MEKSKRIYLSSPHMSDEGYEMELVKEAFDTNWIAPLGKNVDNFETELSDLVGVQSAVALNSGTAAIHLALKASGVSEGDIVFCSTLTFSASANPITYQGAKPVFIDSDYKTWNMSPEKLEEAFKKYPEAKAVIAVHLYGISAEIDQIKLICEKNNAVLIEDAAESLGTIYKGRASGTFGDYGIYSFNGNKIITTSGGGMLVSNMTEKVDKARFWSTQSRDQARYYQHSEIGYNYRMSNVVAGIGRGQLKVLSDRVAKKKFIYEYYKTAFSDLEAIEMMPTNTDDQPNYWLSCALLKEGLDPFAIISELEKHNIESRHVWKPMHMQPVFEACDCIGGEVAEDLFKRGLCLPSDTKMTEEDLSKIVQIIFSAIKGDSD